MQLSPQFNHLPAKILPSELPIRGFTQQNESKHLSVLQEMSTHLEKKTITRVTIA